MRGGGGRSSEHTVPARDIQHTYHYTDHIHISLKSLTQLGLVLVKIIRGIYSFKHYSVHKPYQYALSANSEEILRPSFLYSRNFIETEPDGDGIWI